VSEVHYFTAPFPLAQIPACSFRVIPRFRQLFRHAVCRAGPAQACSNYSRICQRGQCDNLCLATGRRPLTHGWRRRAVLWHVCALVQEEATERRIHPDKKRRDVCATRKLSRRLQGRGLSVHFGPRASSKRCGTCFARKKRAVDEGLVSKNVGSKFAARRPSPRRLKSFPPRPLQSIIVMGNC